MSCGSSWDSSSSLQVLIEGVKSLTCKSAGDAYFFKERYFQYIWKSCIVFSVSLDFACFTLYLDLSFWQLFLIKVG